MPLNKVKGNMYAFLNDYPFREANRGYTINFIKGICPYQCVYCYYQNNLAYKSKIGELRLDTKEFKTDLGKDNYTFVGSSTDMLAEEIPKFWIIKILNYISQFDNKYLLQTKNPARFQEFLHLLPMKTVLGTTIETNRNYYVSKAPSTVDRGAKMIMLGNRPKMISIEPILDFDINPLINTIKLIKPLFVSIGADSKKHNLPEPSKDKIDLLISGLNKFTEVKIKDNLKRLLK